MLGVRAVTAMAAISIREAWASAIVTTLPGAKRIENRTRNVNYRGQIAIHVSLTIDRQAWNDPRIQTLADQGMRAVPNGFVIAVADLVDCHPADECGRKTCDPWGDPTGHHLVLDNVHRLPRPIAAKGSLGLPWRLPEDVDLAVQQQLKEKL